MKKPINFRPILGMIFLLALAMAGLNLGRAAHASGSAPVMVTNSAASPVPVTGSVTGTVTGSVSVSNTPNVNVANNATVTVSNTPSVSLAGTPTVNLGNPITLAGTPTVNLANGGNGVTLSGGSATFNPAAVVDSQPNVIFEPSEDLGGTKDYFFPRTVQTSCLIIGTSNDIDVILGVNPPSAIAYNVPLGRIRAGASPVIINFAQPVPIQRVTVHNPDILIHATFAISALGN